MTPHPGSIAVQQLFKAYRDPDGGQRPVLEGLDFSVAPGEFLCLLGPSGCGKSTLLRLLSGLESPDAGRVHISPDRDQMGMVFQQGGLFPWLTLEDNLLFILDSREPGQKARHRQAVAGLLTEVGLGEFHRHYPHQVSGGMQQRLAVARSFAIDPDILLMDEPFVHLDYQTRWQLQQLLLNLWQERRSSVLFVTHDVEEALALADRILVMSARPGRVIADIPVDLPRPRRLLTLKKDPDFHRRCADIIDLIAGDLLETPA